MSILRRLVLSAAAGLLTLGLAGLTTPTEAADSGWGCGGICLGGPRPS